MNKYESYVTAMKELKTDMGRKNCESLIKQTQEYYSNYLKSKHLSEISSAFAKLYEVVEVDGMYKPKKNKNQIDFNKLLGVSVFFELMKIENTYTDEGFFRFLNAYHGELEMLNEDYQLDKIQIFPSQRISLYEWIAECCATYLDMAKKTEKEKFRRASYTFETLNTVRNAVSTYNKHSRMGKIDEETAFNVMMSREYTELLITVMRENEGLLPLHIAPIRRMLSAGTEGQEIDYKGWGEYFDEGFRVKTNLSKYYKTIEMINSYEPHFKLFEFLDNKCNSILAQIKENKE